MGLFGKKEAPKPYQAAPLPAPAPDINAIQHSIEARSGNIEMKIRRCDEELAGYKAEMARHLKGSTQHNMYKDRAMRVLRQRKMYEGQLSSSRSTQNTFDQVSFARDTVREVQASAQYMKATNKVMQKEMAKVDVNELEDLQDELEDILQDTKEMTDILGRNYDVGEINEAELEAELSGIGEEFNLHNLSAPAYAPAAQQYSQGAVSELDELERHAYGRR